MIAPVVIVIEVDPKDADEVSLSLKIVECATGTQTDTIMEIVFRCV